MLRVEKCRELLGNEAAGKSDAELERLRDEFTSLAEVLLEQVESFPLASKAGRLRVIEGLPPEMREEVGERAAIMEFDGGMSQGAAERAALLRLVGRSGRVE